MVVILDGKKLAAQLADKLSKRIEILKNRNIISKFVVINASNDPASKVYIRAKKRLAEKIGIELMDLHFDESTTQNELLNLIRKSNKDDSINGIMIQFPVLKQFNPDKLIDAIDPMKDVDALTVTNIGHLWRGDYIVTPATASGVMKLLEHYKINLAGKNVVIIGRSNIVGKPLAALLLQANATVSILHSKTQNVASYTKQADIVVVAIGKANFLKADMIKPGATIIDIGINRIDNKIYGDVDFNSVQKVASAITPVPGGIGPLTVEGLMEQVVTLTEIQNGR